MQSVQLKVDTKQQASRTELLVRLVYWIPLVIVGWILGLIAGICWFITVLTVLLLGKRFEALTKIINMNWVYSARMGAYYSFLTDERPPIIPENL